MPLQQIGFGGQDTLRGYRQDLLLGDNGASLSAEVRIPVLRVPEVERILQIVPFIDSAMVWTSSGEANPKLASGDRYGLTMADGKPYDSFVKLRYSTHKCAK